MMFRTRGVYLDFKEILKDPPRTPPEIIIDPRLLTNDKEVDKLQQKLDEIGISFFQQLNLASK